MSPNRVDVAIGRNVMEHRITKGLTVNEMADVLGLDTHQYTEVEFGLRRLTAEQLFAAARALGVRSCEFFSELY